MHHNSGLTPKSQLSWDPDESQSEVKQKSQIVHPGRTNQGIQISESKQQLTVLRAIDKLDRVGTDGVKQLLTTGREDKSGDKTISVLVTRQTTHPVYKKIIRILH